MSLLKIWGSNFNDDRGIEIVKPLHGTVFHMIHKYTNHGN